MGLPGSGTVGTALGHRSTESALKGLLAHGKRGCTQGLERGGLLWLRGWCAPVEQLDLVRSIRWAGVGDTARAALPTPSVWAPQTPAVLMVSRQQELVWGSLPPFSLLPRDPSSLCPCPQVAAMGCQSFALLFDDIDPCMCQADRDVFPSLAQAQASVANEVYQELGQPSIFLFCPTGTACSCAAPATPWEPSAWPTMAPHSRQGCSLAGCSQHLYLLRAECPDSLHSSPQSLHAPAGALEISGLGQDQAVDGLVLQQPCMPYSLHSTSSQPLSIDPRQLLLSWSLRLSRDALCSLPRVLQLSVLSQSQPVLLPADHRPGAAPRDWYHLDR